MTNNLDLVAQEFGKLMINLFEVALRNDIKVRVTDELPSNDPDLCVPSQRKIIINENFSTSIDPTIRLAHEISHILFNDYETNRVYAFSIGSKKASEQKAHYEGLRLVAGFLYQDTPIEYRNWAYFMNWFGLPASFEPTVRSAIESV